MDCVPFCTTLQQFCIEIGNNLLIVQYVILQWIKCPCWLFLFVTLSMDAIQTSDERVQCPLSAHIGLSGLRLRFY